MSKMKTTEEFVADAKKIHRDRYDYSAVTYKGTMRDVEIICKKHGVFKQKAHNHINGSNCPKCASNRALTTKEFINKARKVHGDRYDYSLVNYKNSATHVLIKCSKHNIFKQAPNNHLRGGNCPDCRGKYTTTKELLTELKECRGNIYDYSLVEYVSNKVNIKIICSIHGVFEQKIRTHLNGSNCPKCVGRTKLSTKEFTDKAIKIHGDRYDYSLVDYKNSSEKVKIICSTHGIFEQTAKSHLAGKGCKVCNKKLSAAEKSVQKWLSRHNYQYRQEVKVDADKLKHQSFDFQIFIEDRWFFLEIDGPLHRKAIEFFGGEDALKRCQISDKKKNKYCKDRNISLLRLEYDSTKRKESIKVILNKLETYIRIFKEK